jgi:hypothetical protein
MQPEPQFLIAYLAKSDINCLALKSGEKLWALKNALTWALLFVTVRTHTETKK